MTAVPRPSREVRAVAGQAGRLVRALVTVPYDFGLAAPAPLDVRRLRRATRRALVDVADAVLAGRPTRRDLTSEPASPDPVSSPADAEERV
jgi:hypothetical protein